ncbi:hypothetical protein D3C72_1294360 [compost metagenome]
MKVTWLTGSLRNLLSITWRALYSARSVRADRPFTPMVFWYSRKVSSTACGSRSYRSSLAISIRPARS